MKESEDIVEENIVEENIVEEAQPTEKDMGEQEGAERKTPSLEDMGSIFQNLSKMLDEVMPAVKPYLTSLTDGQREQIRNQIQSQFIDQILPPRSGEKKEKPNSEKEYLKSLLEWTRRSSASFSAPPPHPPTPPESYMKGIGYDYWGAVPPYGFGSPGISAPHAYACPGMDGYADDFSKGHFGMTNAPQGNGVKEVMEKQFEYRKGECRGRTLTYLSRIPDKIQKFINERTDNALTDLITNLTGLFAETKKVPPGNLGICIGTIKAFFNANRASGLADFTLDLGFSSEDFKKTLNTLRMVVAEFECMLPFIWAEESSEKQSEQNKNPAEPPRPPNGPPPTGINGGPVIW
jgi:hypothetical protein